jgi:Spy/CpxP family protein refolding chaperone
MSRCRQTALGAALMISAALVFSSNTVLAQNPSGSATDEQKLDQQIDLMRKDVRSQKKQIIAANLKLTDQEAEKFWPIYDRYTAELVKINDTKYALIKEYAQNFGSMSDDQLDKSTRQWLGLDQSVAQLRLKYLPIFRNVLSAKNTALFYQLDRRIGNMIDLKVASGIPLVEP